MRPPSSLFPNLLICLIWALLPACAASSPETPRQPSSRDMTGLTPTYNQEAQSLFAKARILWNMEERCAHPELALDYLDTAIALQPDYAEAYLRRAMAWAELGDWEAAFTDSSRGIRLRPVSDNYASRAIIFMRQGNYLGARKDLTRALQLDARNARAQDFLRRLDAYEAAQNLRQPRE